MGSILYWTVVLSALDLFSAYQPAPGVNSLTSKYSRSSESFNHNPFNGIAAAIYNEHTRPIRDGSISSDGEQVYEPKEDPRMFYLSKEYLNGPNPVNHEVAAVYPSRRSGAERVPPPRSYRLFRGELKERGSRRICVRCPHDRTLHVKPGLHGAPLRRPRVLTCSGLHVRRNVHFVHLFGPRFGSLLAEGEYTVEGRIVVGNTTVQNCRLHVLVTREGCATPRYLVSSCDELGTCDFSCRDPRHRMRGETSLQCHGDTWSGNLPTCYAPSWCKLPQPPDHGHLSCQASESSASRSSVLAEGSRCRVRCERGWRSARPYSVVCRRGYWNKELTCVPKLRHNSLYIPNIQRPNQDV